MRVLDIVERPTAALPYLNASPRGAAEVASLPIVAGLVDALPPGLRALLVASDLQGVAADAALGGMSRLLGEELADVYCALADQGRVPPPELTGVVLAGDLYSAPDARERGASGDVRSVWTSFAASFRWVAGVEGNHDRFGTGRERARFEACAGVHLLDGRIVSLDGLRIGGVGLISGNPDKPGRRSEEEQIARLERVLEQAPELLVVHEGPSGERHQRGSAAVREVLVRRRTPLTICGHRPWREPLSTLDTAGQVLNVTERAIVLTCAR